MFFLKKWIAVPVQSLETSEYAVLNYPCFFRASAVENVDISLASCEIGWFFQQSYQEKADDRQLMF